MSPRKAWLIGVTLVVLAMCVGGYVAFGWLATQATIGRAYSERVYRVAALAALGMSEGSNKYGIVAGFYGRRCDFWSGEFCAGIAANKALLSAPADLAKVVRALERACDVLGAPAPDGSALQDWVAALAAARQFAQCGQAQQGGPSRVFLALYDGHTRDLTSDKISVVIEIKRSK